jgi:hypothetical protein
MRLRARRTVLERFDLERLCLPEMLSLVRECGEPARSRRRRRSGAMRGSGREAPLSRREDPGPSIEAAIGQP